MARSWPSQFAARPTFETPTKPLTSVLTRVDRPFACMSKSSTSFHIGARKHDMPLLPEILLRDLKLDRLIRPSQHSKQRRRGLADLEVDRPVLDLEDDVVVERAVERLEVVHRGARTIVFDIAPVHEVVVDKSAIEDDAAVRRQRPGHDVRGICVRASVR